MSFEINEKEKTVIVKKDCKRCSHLKVCKFHSKMSELCKSNEFYGMNEYLESNNTLEVFELHARCGQYKVKFNTAKNSPVGLDTERNILEKIAYAEFKARIKDGVSSYSIDEKNDTCFCNPRNGEKQTFKLSELISEYKFG
jgi:hypothetical protein